jgi:hypothetical protein
VAKILDGYLRDSAKIRGQWTLHCSQNVPETKGEEHGEPSEAKLNAKVLCQNETSWPSKVDLDRGLHVQQDLRITGRRLGHLAKLYVDNSDYLELDASSRIMIATLT